MPRRPKQTEITFKPHRGRHGGWRPGAGRKKSRHSGVPHTRRAKLASRFPVHVSLKVRREVGKLRNKRCYNAIRVALIAGCRLDGFRVCHHSVQNGHIHLIVEADNGQRLSRGVQGLCIRIARKLNKALDRRGPVFADRYFSRILKTPREVRNCVAYVLNNFQKHRFGKGDGLRELAFDSYSNASTFDGWRRQVRVRVYYTGPPCVAEPHTWLLEKGWRRHGLLKPAYVPQWGNSW